MKRLVTSLFSIPLVAGFPATLSAALQPRLGGAAVYDTDLNITWLANANLAMSNSFGTAGVNADGTMPWSTAQNWIASMNAAGYLGFSNWRLPTTPAQDPTCKPQGTLYSSCTGSELGHLFYTELGGSAGMSIAQAHNANYSLFQNLQAVNDYGRYWSGSTYPPDPSSAWLFTFGTGNQTWDSKSQAHFVWAVLPGDVGIPSVLSQFAFGGGWYSAVYFTNVGSAPVSFPVNFVSDAGVPLNVPAVGGSSTIVSLAAGATAVIEAPNNGALSEGYVLMTQPVGVESYGVFRQSVSGIADQEAVAPIAGTMSGSSTLIWDETSFTTAVALVNLNSTGTNVSITVRNAGGAVIGTSSVSLPANGKIAAILKSLPGLSGMAGNRGSADFTVPSGGCAVLGLRFNGSAFTSIPVVQH